jgi:polysaccharide export outer membrane protein
VNRKGAIVLPLVGELTVGGKSVTDVEQLLRERLTEYLHQPEVSVFVSEYHSQQVSVTGAVKNPALHTLARPRTVLELLSMSGGLTPEAGNQVYVQTTIKNEPHRFIVDLAQVLSSPNNKDLAMFLRGGDSIFVPEAGVVFVEGAVEKPGSYPLQGDTGVIEAVAMAGSTKFDAREKDVQVITFKENGEREIVSVNLEDLRANKAPNITLRDGDIVLVPSNSMKKGLAGFWNGFRGIFGMGFTLNGP